MNPCKHRTFPMCPRLLAAALFAAITVTGTAARADLFGSGENAFEIEFVTIGDPGNPADITGDPNPAGSVSTTYRIGKYEISEEMIYKVNAASAEAGAPLGITIDQRGPNKPATRASWFEAAQFVNWLNTSKGSTPAYKFDENGGFQLWQPDDEGYNPANLFRNSQARYFLPSVDEWYKAAFYDPVTDVYFDFPNGSDIAPIPVASGTDPGTAVWNQPFEQGPADVMLAGGPSPFGTVGQAGNVHELQETTVGLVNDDPLLLRVLRGGQWISAINATSLSSAVFGELLPMLSVGDVGFRVASVPEPSAVALLVLALLTYSIRCHRTCSVGLSRQ